MDANGPAAPFSALPHGLDRRLFTYASGPQVDYEPGPPFPPALGAHRPAELLAEAAGDVETHADAALVVHAAVDGLALGERLEDRVGVGGKADAVVLDRDLHVATATGCRQSNE